MRIAIIGCGWAGDRHAQACGECGVAVRWAVDLDAGRAGALRASVAAAREAHTGMDYRDALADPEVDAVSICLPHNLHELVAVEAAAAGKHILVEKPLAATLEGADRMIAAAEQTSVVLMVAENVRFEPIHHKIRELLADGAIGKPALIQIGRECYLRESFIRDRPWFLDERTAAGGIMMAGGIHDVDTMRMLIGEIESVYSLRAPQRFLEMEGDDTSAALFRFQDGAVGVVVESFPMKSLTTASGPEVHTLRIDGELGSLSVREDKTIQVYSEREQYRMGDSPVQHDIHVPKRNTFALLMEHFEQCIRTGQEPITSGRLQRKSLEVVLAAYESMTSGRPVKLSWRLGSDWNTRDCEGQPLRTAGTCGPCLN